MADTPTPTPLPDDQVAADLPPRELLSAWNRIASLLADRTALTRRVEELTAERDRLFPPSRSGGVKGSSGCTCGIPGPDHLDARPMCNVHPEGAPNGQ